MPRRRAPITRRAATRRAVRRRLIAIFGTSAFAAPLAVLAIGTISLGVLWNRFGIGSTADLSAWIVNMLMTAGSVYVIQRVRRRENRLIALAFEYVDTGDRVALDALLSSLIGHRLDREHWDSHKMLFRALTRVLHGEDWEMRRRVAEALPTLGALDPARSLELLARLRVDWDDAKWRGDLRRRALEALILPARGGREPLMLVIEDKVGTSLDDLVALRDDDSVWTALACVEACAWLEHYRPGRGRQVYERSKITAQGRFAPNAVRALEAAWDIWAASWPGPSGGGGVNAIFSALAEDVIAMQVAAARAIHRYATHHPIAFLDVIDKISCQKRHRYVRRVAAREANVSNLLQHATKGKHRRRAADLMERLMGDDDDIIPLTVFDLVETWTEGRGRVAESLADLAVQRGRPEDLVQRAQRTKRRLQAASSG